MGSCYSKQNKIHDRNKIFIKDYNNNAYDLRLWRNRDECCICLDKKCNILLLPCDHLVLCDECCRNIYHTKKCPVCQEDVFSYNFLQIISAIPN